MTRKELCEMCTEYSTDAKCEHRNTCKLQEILTENASLKQEVKDLKSRLFDLESEKRWDMFPDMMGK